MISVSTCPALFMEGVSLECCWQFKGHLFGQCSDQFFLIFQFSSSGVFDLLHFCLLRSKPVSNTICWYYTVTYIWAEICIYGDLAKRHCVWSWTVMETCPLRASVLLSPRIWQLPACCPMSKTRVCASEQQTVTWILFKNKAKSDSLLYAVIMFYYHWLMNKAVSVNGLARWEIWTEIYRESSQSQGDAV